MTRATPVSQVYRHSIDRRLRTEGVSGALTPTPRSRGAGHTLSSPQSPGSRGFSLT